MDFRQLANFTSPNSQDAHKINTASSPTYHDTIPSFRVYRPGVMPNYSIPKYKSNNFHNGGSMPDTKNTPGNPDKASYLNISNSGIPQTEITPPLKARQVARKPVPWSSNISSNSTNSSSAPSATSDIQERFNVDSDIQDSSSRLRGIKVPKILGIAPSLEDYHALWRFRYTLEIQLPHRWDSFQQRFHWSGMRDSCISTPSLDVEISVIEELISILELTHIVLSETQNARPPDCRNAQDFIEAELASLEEDILIYSDILVACKRELWEEQGRSRRKSFVPEIWERDAFVQATREFDIIR